MCIQYWPPARDKTEVYGDIHIGILKEEQLANFQIRTFAIWKENLDVNHLANNSTDNNAYSHFLFIQFCFFFLSVACFHQTQNAGCYY